MHTWAWLQCLENVLMRSKSKNVLFCMHLICFTVFIKPFIIIHDYLFPLTNGVTRVTMMHPFIISASNIISFTCRDSKSSIYVSWIAALTLSNPHWTRKMRKNPPAQENLENPQSKDSFANFPLPILETPHIRKDNKNTDPEKKICYLINPGYWIPQLCLCSVKNHSHPEK